MGTSGSAPKVTREDTLSLFSRLEEPCAPLSAEEAAARLECPKRTARMHLDARDALQLQIEESDVEAETEPLPSVDGDPAQLRQVFQNLLDNAIEYSGDDPPHVRITAERSGPDWRLSVSDEGIGIDPDGADRIFEVFQRLHHHDEHRGTGIGLALCRRIIERHGGEIWVESEPDEGATFSFTLPAEDETNE